VRLRLTVLYGSLFLVCGAALLGVTYILVEHALPGPVLLSAQSGPGAAAGGSVSIGTGQPTTDQPTTGQATAGQSVSGQSSAGRSSAGQSSAVQPATSQPATSQPATSQPATGQPATGQFSAGQSVTGPSGTGQSGTGQSATSPPAPGQPVQRTFSQACAGQPPAGTGLPATSPKACAYLSRALRAQRSAELGQLLIDCGIALGIMALASIGLGWLVAGRVLRPLRTIAAAAQRVSASSLNHRLALDGPDDELRELGETFNGLLARLEGSFGAQRQFVANASHELRTPLARQRTLVEVALADPQRSARSLQAACERVLAAGAQQEHLIESMLTLARSQRGLESRATVDLREVTAEVVRAVPSNGLRVETELGDAHTMGDQAMVERLVANLVENAVRYNRPDGWISAWTGRRDGLPTIEVTNIGPVVESVHVDQLVKPFYRAGETRAGETGSRVGENGKGRGLGLGLSIVQAIAEAHGAVLETEARPEGGLRVAVAFPAADAARESSA
jgi:signal transduction histidine kinase